MKPEHKHLSRMRGYTLTHGTPEAWGGFSVVAQARLSIFERAGLAVASLKSLPEGLALDTAAAALGAAGRPLPPFLGGKRLHQFLLVDDLDQIERDADTGGTGSTTPEKVTDTGPDHHPA